LISSPLLIGFIHPRIILPDADLSGSDFYYTMLHELIHYKRRDMLYKWLVQLTICLHWFNPTVYLMGREINHLCELSCDERVIKSLSEEDRKAYGDTLLNAADTGGSYRDTLASVTLNENKELLKGRLDAIMNYRKMTKSIRTAAILFTGILIGAATVLGAYASPAGRTASDAGISADSETWASFDSGIFPGNENVSDSDGNQALDYSIQHENGIYYVLAHGATEADKPISGVTSLYNMLILVRKDSYATFGAWDDYDMQSLVRHISEQCRTRLANGQLTQEDMDIVIAAATEIQQTYLSGSGNVPDRRTYAYRQTASYQSPYIILYGYNLPSSTRGSYKNLTVALADGLNIQIYFSEETEKFMSDDKAMSAITSMIRHRLLPKSSSSRPLDALFIVSMEDVGDTDLSSLAEKYYKEESLNYFAAVFMELDSAAQQKYLALAYDDQNISFFASCIDDSSTDTVDHYILKAYEDDRVDFFAVLSGMLDEESRQQWLERCEQDGRTNYRYILSEDDAKDYDVEDNDAEDDFYDKYGTDDYDASSTTNILDLNRITKQDL
ncbi:MAG: M56 family metallopeptidase, partial [Lachnospiraceae bacterium]|nr:M56 family metallopeptidase [Lachnospiraceae bacterium]